MPDLGRGDAAEYRYRRHVEKESASSVDPGRQSTTSKSSNDSGRKQDQVMTPKGDTKSSTSSKQKDKAPAMTPAMNIPVPASSQGQINPRAHTGSTSARSTTTDQGNLMSGANPETNPRDGSGKGLLHPTHQHSFFVSPNTPPAGSTPADMPASSSEAVTSILKPAPGPNAPPTQPGRIQFAKAPEDGPPPRSGPSIYKKKTIKDQMKKHQRDLQDDAFRKSLLDDSKSSNEPDRGRSSSNPSEYGEYCQRGEFRSRQAERYGEDDDYYPPF